MGEAIGESLPLAVGIALSPLPIVAVVLMLVSKRGKANGPAFVVGWLVGLAIVGAVVLSIAGPADPTDDGDPATWTGVVKLVLGLLLLLFGVRGWRGRPKEGAAVSPPAWMGAIDQFSPVKALGVGAIFSGLNPKNLLLAVGGATAIAQTEVSGAEQAIAYAVFALIATVGVAAPVVLYLALGERSAEPLDSLKTWMIANNAVIMAVLSVVIGAKLIGDGISVVA